MNLKKLFFLFFILQNAFVFSQSKKQFFSDTLRSVNIDSAMAVTAKRGLTINDFTTVMLQDTMFYEAFTALKKYSFIAENKINTYDVAQKQTGKIYRKIKHVNDGFRYHQELIEKKDSGRVLKYNGDFDLFTVSMFSYIFMNEKNTDFLADKKVTRKVIIATNIAETGITINSLKYCIDTGLVNQLEYNPVINSNILKDNL